MPETSPTPARDSVGAALRLVRTQWRTIAITAAIGAALTAVLTLAGAPLNGQVAALILGLLSIAVLCGVYASLINTAQATPFSPARLAADTGIVWAGVLIVGFVLMLTMFCVAMPVSIALGPYVAPYAEQVQASRGDQTMFMHLLDRFMLQQPGIFALMFIMFAGACLLVSSRFYLSIPASIEARRILTFETWSWTKNNMLRIALARIVLLGPALVLFQTLTILSARAIGFNQLETGDIAAFAERNPLAYAGFTFVAAFLQFFIYNALEAGLSNSFYRALKPNQPASRPA